jgi:hypothetical protein
MRKSTMLWLTLAAFSGAALFHTSQKVHDEREMMVKLNLAIAKEEESLRVLNAEWSYLNQPSRLEKLVKAHLKLAPMKGAQFVKAEDIPLRPAPVATTPVAEPAVGETLAQKEPAAPEKPAAKVAEKSPVKSAAKTTVLPVKILKPVLASAPKKLAVQPAPVTTNAAAGGRSFSDMMRSLRHD